MRFRRNPLIFMTTVVILAGVTVFGLTSDHFGIGAHPVIRSAPTSVSTQPSAAEQAQRLSQGRALRQQGSYEEAISTLQPVISSSDPDQASTALLETAKDQIAIGDDLAAELTLRTLRTKYSTTPAGDEAQFHLGQTEASRGELASAIGDLAAYAKRHADVSAYIDLLISKYQEQHGQLSSSLKLATLVASSSPIPRAQVEALEQMRDTEKKQKDDADYLDVTNRLISLATRPSYRAELIYEKAGAELRLGRNDVATSDLRTILREYPDSAYATNALNDLQRLAGPSAVPDEQRALVDYYRGNYQSAIETFDRVLSATSSSDNAWYFRAMARLRAGDDVTAAVELTEMADRYSSSSLTPGALYTAGKIYEDETDLDSALLTYHILIQQFPFTAEATNGRLRAGFVLYERGDYGGAIAMLAPVRGPAKAEAEASFWEGKSFLKLGQRAQATQVWTNSSEVDPTDYFGLRAAQLISGNQPVTPATPETSIAAPLPESEQSDLASWYADAGTTAESARAAVRQDSDYRRMTLLFDLGLTTQAGWEMSALADKYGTNPALLATLGQLLEDAGEYNAAYRVGIRLQIVADDSAVRLPLALRRLAYPLAYPALTQTQASAHNIDPLLFLALVRQESGYDPNVTSSANAIGLAQVVPSTAGVLAKALNIDSFSADMLYRPVIAVQFGTLYLSVQLARYHGVIYSALAGYNAGDSNVDTWLTRNGSDDPDVFVEQIPFPETHDYVQNVYANYLNYLRIYR